MDHRVHTVETLIFIPRDRDGLDKGHEVSRIRTIETACSFRHTMKETGVKIPPPTVVICAAGGWPLESANDLQLGLHTELAEVGGLLFNPLPLLEPGDEAGKRKMVAQAKHAMTCTIVRRDKTLLLVAPGNIIGILFDELQGSGDLYSWERRLNEPDMTGQLMHATLVVRLTGNDTDPYSVNFMPEFHLYGNWRVRLNPPEIYNMQSGKLIPPPR